MANQSQASPVVLRLAAAIMFAVVLLALLRRFVSHEFPALGSPALLLTVEPPKRAFTALVEGQQVSAEYLVRNVSSGQVDLLGAH